MNLLDKALFYLSVPKCVCCKERLDIDDGPLCKLCTSAYASHKRIKDCSVCARVLEDCTCPNDYLESHYIKRLLKVCRYTHREDRKIPSNHLIYSIKRDNRKDVLKYMTGELLSVINKHLTIDDTYVITSVPRGRKNYIKYGIDHASLLSREIAKNLGISYVEPLKSLAKQQQKKTLATQRFTNAEFDYKDEIDLSGKRIILIDDIVTTGASMGACASLLHALGAKEIIGCAFAIAFRDKPDPLYIQN